MRKRKVWLYFHKASLAPQSAVNMDGSDFSIGISVVPADSLSESEELFKESLSKDHMTALEIFNVTEFSPENTPPNTDLNRQILKTIEHALRRDLVHYICEDTSQAINERE